MNYHSVANPGPEWERLQNPAAAGWSVAGLRAVGSCADQQETDALMVVQGNKIVYTYGDITHKYLCHSIRKSILAALMGQDVADGTIDLSLTLEQLGIDDNEGLSEVEKQATVYDLLTARSGIYHPAGYETPWMRMIKEKRHPMRQEPSGVITTGISMRLELFSNSLRARPCIRLSMNVSLNRSGLRISGWTAKTGWLA